MTAPPAVREPIDRKALLLTSWCAVPFMVLGSIGLIVFADFIPIPSPMHTADEIAQLYRENTTGIRVGMALLMFSAPFLAIWGGGIIGQLRRTESRIPVLTYAQLGILGTATFVTVLAAVTWTLGAFRPNDLPAETIRMLNDLGWLVFIYSAPVFAIWCLLIGFMIMFQPRDEPVYPRWVMYLNFWVALAFAPDILVAFFKHGGFAFNGLFGFWIPGTAFFYWMVAMTLTTLRANRVSTVGAEHQVPADAHRATLSPTLASHGND